MPTYSSTTDEPEREAAHAAVRPVLVEILKGMTGQGFTDAKGWLDGWKGCSKTWKPGDRP